MVDLTWGDGVVLTDRYSGTFRITYITSTEAGAWVLSFESLKGDKVTYELFVGDMDATIGKGMSLFNGVEAETTELVDTSGVSVV